MKKLFNWYNSADRDVLSASILGAAGLLAAWVMVM
mgnify:CR=1 FL=1